VYETELLRLQAELVTMQEWVRSTGQRMVVVFEGRDAAGKGSTIKRITQYLNPRVARIAALPAPSDRERSQWYFQRYVAELPAAGEIVLFDRSWYNRAGVERVMGFCTERDVKQFFATVNDFESLLVRAGIEIRKYYLDISHEEQKERLKARQKDPLKTWKNSPIDAAAGKKWRDYGEARDDMLRRSSNSAAPWRIVHADHKHKARLELIRDLLDSFDYKGKSKKLVKPDRGIVFKWSSGRHSELAR